MLTSHFQFFFFFNEPPSVETFLQTVEVASANTKDVLYNFAVLMSFKINFRLSEQLFQVCTLASTSYP